MTLPLAATGPAYAADRCQHSSHYHYHFPYAHDDYHRYDGHHVHSYENRHWNHYRNATHANSYEKRCD